MKNTRFQTDKDLKRSLIYSLILSFVLYFVSVVTGTNSIKAALESNIISFWWEVLVVTSFLSALVSMVSRDVELHCTIDIFRKLFKLMTQFSLWFGENTLKLCLDIEIFTIGLFIAMGVDGYIRNSPSSKEWFVYALTVWQVLMVSALTLIAIATFRVNNIISGFYSRAFVEKIIVYFFILVVFTWMFMNLKLPH